ncbi:protein translocase subunit SecF [Pseudoteredinibacter isoporae]|uniref:Protein-export membrane protein SecF n=1 Tax=Pseudoteredinibacter isoporae TaxID=570281 RepID=A0A7X0JVN4_9GAMM|nr:protein translocase subunit SecF [Pseudoteredinibacter isoporae]MBB6522644.1 preprotein translocase subunit SecF [Pseudoteredinibacter isoporae]NHO88174.1 protein translocase subunit SecF [Pseudoteredinibacter isoporae]NIB23495.1 protein translocase subunit SecF [Pseudoteredinibacter isoporae]
MSKAKKELKVIRFMSQRKLAAVFSVLLLIGSIFSLATNGLKFGLDFTGGSQIEVGYTQPANVNEIRQQLEGAGFPDPIVVHFGAETDVLIRMQEDSDAELGDKVISTLRADGSEVELRRVEYVGPQVGEELRDDGGIGMLFALAVVMIYVAMRFQFKFSVGAVAALAHDVIIVLGVFSVLQIDFDLTVLAAVLAVIGYSLNDTIVVSDRIRENFRKIRKADSVEVIDISLTQTLGRTLVTSLTTLLVLMALFYFGGELIHGFSIALLVGVAIGTYSSIYVAANVLLMMNISKEDLMQIEKEGEELDEMP